MGLVWGICRRMGYVAQCMHEKPATLVPDRNLETVNKIWLFIVRLQGVSHNPKFILLGLGNPDCATQLIFWYYIKFYFSGFYSKLDIVKIVYNDVAYQVQLCGATTKLDEKRKAAGQQ